MTNDRHLERCTEWRSADIHQEPGEQTAMPRGYKKTRVGRLGYLTQYEYVQCGGVSTTQDALCTP